MPEKKIPDGYEKHFIISDNGKTFDVYYNPKEKDSLKAYIKVEVK